MQLKEKFKELWFSKVEDIAKKCSNIEVFNLMKQIEYGNISDEEKEMIAKQLEEMNIHDINAVWYIGFMISDIQKCIFQDKINLNLINSVCQINGCLNSDSYWSNVWDDNINSEEAKNLKELGILMQELVKYL